MDTGTENMNIDSLGQAAGFEAAAPPREGARILVVDDDLALREAVSALLRQGGYRTTAVPDAPRALAMMAQEQPDLVLADVKMPEMDGYAFFEHVRRNPDWQSIPFIFMSAKAYPHDIRLGYELGADHYLTKPFDREDLLVSVDSHLARARAIREAAGREWESRKQEFVTILGHELRTPLFLIQGYLSLAQEKCGEGNTELVEKLLAGMDHGARRLGKRVEDMLMLANIDAGVAQAEVKRFSRACALHDHLKEAVEKLGDRASKANVKIISDLGTKVFVRAIPAHLQMILQQLIDNAIKFSPRQGGTVWVTVAENDGMASLRVRDQGLGIPPSHQPMLFKPFEQLNRRQQEQQGLGIGLYIARALARMQQGDITFQTEPGLGSTFTLTLPAISSPQNPAGISPTARADSVPAPVYAV